ncbi:MAG: helix-hairpin-helix domain-containing protein [Clostridia bacterium]
MKKINNLVKEKINKIKSKLELKSNIFKLSVLTVTVILICIVVVYIQSLNNNVLEINDKKMESEYGKVCIYLSGAVLKNGVYKFDEGITLEKAINLAGGVTEKADISKLNLSKVLQDKEKIVVPEFQTELEKIEEKIESESILININNASKEKLMELEGIGESTANKIIEYRKLNSFEDIEDIKKVSGIGENKYEKIKESITVE